MLEYYIRQQELRGKMDAVAEARKLLAQHGDIPLSNEPILRSAIRELVLPLTEQLVEVIAEYRAGRLNTPEAVTSSYQKIWAVRSRLAGIAIVVPDFPDSEEGLKEHLSKYDMPFLVPAELSTNMAESPVFLKTGGNAIP